ncbi:integrator complex subunit 2-like [Lineus longissimus]|uniref:integrator complex subunit 2-like n=1 Tax=Lineus longissimus TaxID=88925 RepID=UPI002B4F8371
MVDVRTVSSSVFEALRDVNIKDLLEIPEKELRCILPCLVRMALCAPLDTSAKWNTERKRILQILSGLEVVNGLVALLSIDFHALEQDARKEQQLRAKIGGSQNDSILISQLQHGIAIEFERSDAARKLRLVLSELLFVMSQIREPRSDFYTKSSDLFDSEVYLEEVSDVMCIAQAELPNLLPMTDVSETLLHMKNGNWLLSRLVANAPDSFLEVCTSLVMNGEKQEEESLGGRKRSDALQMLCEMNPAQILHVRAICVSNCRLPSLAVQLTLHHCQHSEEDGEEDDSGVNELVSFISGLLLGSDTNVRNWFAQFVRNGQKKKETSPSTLSFLRQHLLQELNKLFKEGSNKLPEEHIVQASAFTRLYCALKGIAGLRFSDDESKALLRLVTCHPPPSLGGVRLVTLGLCMLIGCPQLISGQEPERTAVEWIKWLVKEESKFEIASGVAASFGEMLFLIAIHFHGNQTQAIAELVCTTLGMKSAVKANALSRLKQIFTQDIFNEQVVTSHAVKVAVTPRLNADLAGFLPIHCIFQLLKSRAFSKHKVPIKDWIYRQICSSAPPLHPLLPPLIETFITSILMPSIKTAGHTNEPFTEEEIISIFKSSALMKTSQADAMEVDSDTNNLDSFTSQLLMLYYILLYEDCLMSNMKSIVASSRRVKRYSQNLISQLPIKYLLQQAQREQQLYAGLFSPMLKLLATHFPHLCLVQDWLDEELHFDVKGPHHPVNLNVSVCNGKTIQQAFDCLGESSTPLLMQLEYLQSLPMAEIIKNADVIIENLPKLLEEKVPRKLQDLVQNIWVQFNTVMTRRLRVMTVNALRSNGMQKGLPYTEDDMTVDPLIVLRCDVRVFRCPPILEIVLRTLLSYLQASRAYLTSHCLTNPIQEKNGPSTANQEREELKNALIATQESTAVQILLEACLPRPEEKGKEEAQNNLREIHCLICSHLHQVFIADPNLAKLVHFQGYPSELLPMTVRGIPSMHICLDFIPELLSQPDMHKQIFSIELVSFLSLQYALPKSLGIAKLAVSVMTTLLGVLTADSRSKFFLPVLPALVRIGQAFPPLCEDIINLLTQLGHVCAAHISATRNKLVTSSKRDEDDIFRAQPNISQSTSEDHKLFEELTHTFSQIVQNTVIVKSVT